MRIDIPYPEINMSGGTMSTEQVNEYLYKLAESLEFALGDINVENLSKELMDMIGAGINEETVKQYAEDALRSANSFARRIVNDAVKTLEKYADDVAKAAEDGAKKYADSVATGGGAASVTYLFTVNYETGQLEYEKEEQEYGEEI